MGHGHDPVQAEADMNSWVKISAGAFGACGVIAAYVTYVESQHEHHHDEEARSYKKIRNKPFPWSCNDCSFFDLQCFRECKANK